MIKATTTAEKVILPKPGLYQTETGRRIRIRSGDQTLLDTAQERKADNLKKAEEKRARKAAKKQSSTKIVLKSTREWMTILNYSFLNMNGFDDMVGEDLMSANEFRQRAAKSKIDTRYHHL